MAVVKMGQIKHTPAKALAYIARDDATRNGMLVSTNTAVIDPSDWRAVANAMGETSARMGVTTPREGSVLAHHVIQSFDPSEKVDPEEAHRIGRELAERITGGTHEFMIATHVDKDHVHNHIIFNAVNMETGRKFRVQKDTIGRVRDMSDVLCREAGLKVLPPAPKRTTAPNMAELYAIAKGESYKHGIRVEIDKATQKARTWDEFVGELRLAGIEVSQSRGEVSYRDESSRRSVRDYRLGEPYTEHAVMARLGRSEVNRIDVDRSMIVSQSSSAFFVKVPGTHGELMLSVPKEHVVWHGRTMRAYVPSEGHHVLTNPAGTYLRRVSTAGLYEWFSRPHERGMRSAVNAIAPMRGVFNAAELHTWRESLTAVHQIEAQINAQGRWAPTGDIASGLTEARAEVGQLRSELQAQLVALAELADMPDVSEAEMRSVSDALRGLELRLSAAKRDVDVLAAMQQAPARQAAPTAVIEEDRPKTLRERIQLKAEELGRQETVNTHPQERAAQRSRTDEKEADFIRDREGGDGDGDDTRASAVSLRERIAERVKSADLAHNHNEEGRDLGWRR